MPKEAWTMTAEPTSGPSMLERIDLALASRLVAGVEESEPLAAAQGVLDALRRPQPGDVAFLAGVLRLRGFVVTDDDAVHALAGTPGRLSPVAQEYRLLRGLGECLVRIRERACQGRLPDGLFVADLFRTLTANLPRFRNNDLRRGPPWDAVLYVNYPGSDELRYLLATLDAQHHFRDQPMLWNALHPVRQGFRLCWRFARIAPFPDFNLVMAWMLLNAWLLAKGYPLLPADRTDQAMLTRLVAGPPPSRMVPLEARLLGIVVPQRHAG